ncbi:MAG: MFS transporter, partial [Actinobacteria bacterium]|nr:MFS transporter [Actinomycetota bacterium]
MARLRRSKTSCRSGARPASPRSCSVAHPRHCRCSQRSSPTDVRNPARHRSCRASVARVPTDVRRLFHVEHRNVDAKRRASGVHLQPHRSGVTRRNLHLRATRAAACSLNPGRCHRRSLRPPQVVDLHSGDPDVVRIPLVPADRASLPSLVPPEDLPGAISLNSTVINGSRVIGPIVVALLANWGVGTSQVFFINSLTYLFVIVALLRVTIPHLAPVGSDEGWRQLTTGVRIARERRVIGRLLLSLATFSFLSLPYVGLFPAVARLNFDIDETGSTYRWLYATWGLGAAIGGLAIGTVLVSVDKRTIIRAGFAFFALFLALFGIANTPLLAFVVAFPLGIAYFGTTTAMMTVLQSRLAPNERGRVMSL